MVPRTVLATLAGSAPQQRLQVSLATRPGGRVMIDLCEQHFAEGIGWFDQRSLRLDPRQFRQLQAVLGMRAADLDAAVEAVEAPATIPLPGPCAAGPRRPAVGKGC